MISGYDLVNMLVCICAYHCDIGSSPSGWKEKPWCISQVAWRTCCYWNSYC